MCDGSDEVRFAASWRVDAGRLAPGLTLLYDHGAAYVFAGGQCDYYVRTGEEYNDARTGTFDVEVLGAADGLRSIPLGVSSFGGSVVDGATLVVELTDRSLVCSGGCSGGDVPDWASELSDALADDLTELHDQGTSTDLPQRVVLYTYDGPAIEPLYEWPAPIDPTTIARDPLDDVEIEFGMGILLPDAADNDALRTLRRQVAATPDPRTAINIGSPTESVQDFQLYVRDALPWEDDRGLIQMIE